MLSDSKAREDVSARLGTFGKLAHNQLMKLDRVILRVQSPESLARFYVEHLGMTVLDEGRAVLLGFGGDDALIEMRPATPGNRYTHRRSDRYWKIGVTLPNVDMACAQLRKADVEVSQPRQFGEIGYMCHLEDPEGFSIELLQHRFGAQGSEGAGDPKKPLGGGARIGQVTLRVADLDAALGFYRDRLRMTLLSIQPVPDYGFTLYFLAFTEERPPNVDLEAVDNREWLWQRPYTTLELQHFRDATTTFTLPAATAAGFAGIVITGVGERKAQRTDDGGSTVELRP